MAGINKVNFGASKKEDNKENFELYFDRGVCFTKIKDNGTNITKIDDSNYLINLSEVDLTDERRFKEIRKLIKELKANVKLEGKFVNEFIDKLEGSCNVKSRFVTIYKLFSSVIYHFSESLYERNKEIFTNEDEVKLKARYSLIYSSSMDAIRELNEYVNSVNVENITDEDKDKLSLLAKNVIKEMASTNEKNKQGNNIDLNNINQYRELICKLEKFPN